MSFDNMNQLIVHSGKNVNIIVNGKSVLNRTRVNVGINLLCFDKHMQKSVLWNFNHTQINMTKKFINIINVLPKHLYCVIIVQGNILRCMNVYIKRLLETQLKCKQLNNLRRFSAWSLVFYRDDNEYVNVRESHQVNNRTSMYLSIFSNPIIAREKALKEYEERQKILDNTITKDDTIEEEKTNIEDSNSNKILNIINYNNELEKYSEENKLDEDINKLENLQKQIQNIHMNIEKISDDVKKSIDEETEEQSKEVTEEVIEEETTTVEEIEEQSKEVTEEVIEEETTPVEEIKEESKEEVIEEETTPVEEIEEESKEEVVEEETTPVEETEEQSEKEVVEE
jgi:hypothetical protein